MIKYKELKKNKINKDFSIYKEKVCLFIKEKNIEGINLLLIEKKISFSYFIKQSIEYKEKDFDFFDFIFNVENIEYNLNILDDILFISFLNNYTKDKDVLFSKITSFKYFNILHFNNQWLLDNITNKEGEKKLREFINIDEHTIRYKTEKIEEYTKLKDSKKNDIIISFLKNCKHTRELSDLTLSESVICFNFDLLKKIIKNNLIPIKSLNNLAIKIAIEYNNIDALSFLIKINPIDFEIEEETIKNAIKNNSFETLYFIKEHIKSIKYINFTKLSFICIENNNLNIFKLFLDLDLRKNICITQQLEYSVKNSANSIFFYIFNNFEIDFNEKLVLTLLGSSFYKNNTILFKFLLNKFSFYLLTSSQRFIKNIDTKNEELMFILLQNKDVIIQDSEINILKGCLSHKNNSVLKMLMKRNISLVFLNNYLFFNSFNLERIDICKIIITDDIVRKTILHSLMNRNTLTEEEKIKIKIFININLF